MAQQQRAEETRTHILQAGVECFAQNGYDATGVAEICQRAGVTKGGFYHHFPSKQALFLALFEQWLTILDEQLAAFHAEAENVPDGLREMAGMIGQVFEVASGQLPMFLDFWSKAAHDPDVWKEIIAPYRRYQTFFAQMIQEGIDEGTLRPVDPKTAAQTLVSLAVGLLLQGTLDPDGADWAQVTKESIDIYLEGITKQDLKKPGS
ncbi:MAG: TetR/AcrR family transcriptional regulator [Anaerolineae bacterium]|nr:TetR/AcrR family transcriptional regulator [Anaerolineae bacterium]